MNPLGLYEPGTSWLHRAPAGWKLLPLLALSVLVFTVNTPAWLGAADVLVLFGYVAARIPRGRCWQLVRMLGPLLLMIFALQWWFLSLPSATVVCLRLCAALGAANLFTLTTKVYDVVSAVERGLRPLRGLGVRPERAGMLVGLTLHAITALSTIASDTREAQCARNADRDLSAFAVPFLVRTLRHSDELGEALAARGVGD